MRILLLMALSLGCGGREVSALISAARAGETAQVGALLAAGARVDEPGGVNGWTPLMHAIHKGQPEAALLLIAAGADVNARANNDVTPLLLAAGEGDARLVKALLARGANPRARTADGATPLANALAAGAGDVVDALLAADPRLRLEDDFVGSASRLVARLRGKSDLIARLER